MATLKQLSRIFSQDDSLNRVQDQIASALNPILRAVKGDLSGPLESPTVKALQGVPVSNATPVTGNSLVYNGTQWAPSASSGNIVFNTGAIQTLTASTTQQLTPTTTLHRFITGAGNVTLSGVPTIAWPNVVVGQFLILENVGSPGTGHLTLTRGATEKLSLSNGTKRIDEGGTMMLVWDGTNWVEMTHTQATST